MSANAESVSARHAALVGKRFSRLTITGMFRRGSKYIAEVYCDCGTSKSIRLAHIESGATKSCGCLFIETTRRMGLSNITHGMKNTPEFAAWVNMRGRCNNPQHRAYESYGGRGITVCKRWARFENFTADMGLRPTPRHSLDRIDNDKGYAPSNCRWAMPKVQHYNKRNTRRLRAFGEVLTLMDWSARTGIKPNTIRERLRRGWTTEQSLSHSAGTHRHLSTSQGCG
jgi:hypothetical protein